jgi:hypothetical protein
MKKASFMNSMKKPLSGPMSLNFGIPKMGLRRIMCGPDVTISTQANYKSRLAFIVYVLSSSTTRSNKRRPSSGTDPPDNDDRNIVADVQGCSYPLSSTQSEPLTTLSQPL